MTATIDPVVTVTVDPTAVPAPKIVQRRAWDGLSTQTKGLKTAAEVIAASNLGWAVTKEPIFVPNSDNSGHVVVPGQYATIRDDNRDVLGIVGDNYTILQNSEAFAMFDAVAERGEAIYDTAGALRGGSVVWMLAQIPGLMHVGSGDDALEKFLLISNTFDGSGAVNVALTNIRVICQNTLTAALREAGKRGNKFSIKHSGQLADKVAEATKAMGLANRKFLEMEESFNAMLNYRFSDLDAKLFVERVIAPPKSAKGKNKIDSSILVLPPGVDTNTDSEANAEEKETKDKRAVRDIMEIYHSDLDSYNTKEDEHSLWRAVNAVTAWTSHHRTYKSQERTQNSKEDNKLFSVLFGQSADMGERAMLEAQRMLVEVPSTYKPAVTAVAIDLKDAKTVDVDTSTAAPVVAVAPTKPEGAARKKNSTKADNKAETKAKTKVGAGAAGANASKK